MVAISVVYFALVWSKVLYPLLFSAKPLVAFESDADDTFRDAAKVALRYMCGFECISFEVAFYQEFSFYLLSHDYRFAEGLSMCEQVFIEHLDKCRIYAVTWLVCCDFAAERLP